MFVRMKHVSLVALLATMPALVVAQSADPQTEPVAPADPTETAAPADAVPVEAETPPEPVEGQIVMQSEDTILADDLIGSTVYSGENESVGEINDLIVNLNGTVEGVVIGVGGFLGIGQKDVAVEMGSISLGVDPETEDPRLTLMATRADLEAAPAFVTAFEMKARENIEQEQSAPATTDPAADPAVTPEPAAETAN